MSVYGGGVRTEPSGHKRGELTYRREVWGDGYHYLVMRWTSRTSYDHVAHVATKELAKRLGAVAEVKT